MKRRREMEKESCSSELRSAIEDLTSLALIHHHHHHVITDDDAHNHHHDHYRHEIHTHIPIQPFLSLCSFLLHLLDKIGPTMAVFRQDIHRNIQRLEKMQESDPILYSNVVEILKKERNEGTWKKVTSSSKAFIWLTRSLDFTTHLMESIAKDFEVDMEQAVEESYEATLKPWHGWISLTAYRVALKLVPNNKTVVDVLKAKGEDLETLKDEIQTFTSLLLPLLDHIHSALEIYGLDKVKAT